MPSDLATINPDDKLGKSPPITRKVRDAINAMVWSGLPRAEAAAKAGLSDHGLYKALRSPPVKAAYLAECEMLRLSGKARRIHRLNEMVEQDDNKAAVVNAVMALERLGDDNPLSAQGNQRSPGVVIQIIGSGSKPPDVDIGPNVIDVSQYNSSIISDT